MADARDTKKQEKITDQQVAQLKKLAIEVKDWERFMADPGSSVLGRKIDDFKEYQYSVSDLSEFIAFSIKIVMQGTNSSRPPLVKDFRAIALAL